MAVPAPGAPSAGAAVSAGDARPGGSAAAGSGSSARTAQSPRAPPLASPSGVKEIEAPGESAGKVHP
eukprot:8451754-Pyramimonas_sp.AAC.1